MKKLILLFILLLTKNNTLVWENDIKRANEIFNDDNTIFMGGNICLKDKQK